MIKFVYIKNGNKFSRVSSKVYSWLDLFTFGQMDYKVLEVQKKNCKVTYKLLLTIPETYYIPYFFF